MGCCASKVAPELPFQKEQREREEQEKREQEEAFKRWEEKENAHKREIEAQKQAEKDEEDEWEREKEEEKRRKEEEERIRRLEEPDTDGNSPLMQLAKEGDLQGIKDLLSQGADLNAHHAGWNAVTISAGRGHVEVLKYLIETKGDIHIKGTEDSVTPLSNAIMYNRVECIKLLLEAKADLQHEAGEGKKPLHIAAEDRDAPADLIDVLISAQADINELTEDKATPLILAVNASRNLDVLEHIISCKADLTLKDEDGMTALLYAAKSGQQDVCDLLIQSGANPKEPDPYGADLAAVAEGNHHEDLGIYLEKFL